MAKVNLNGDAPKVVWSLNLNAAKVAAAFLVQLTLLAGFAWGVVNWTAGYVFQQELKRFHTEAIPAIERMIDSRSELHKLEIQKETLEKLDEINQRLARIEGRLNNGAH